MKTTIVSYNTPEAAVRIKNINLIPNTRKATLTIGVKPNSKRKFIEEQIEVNISSELYDYFTVLREDKIKVHANNDAGFKHVKTGTRSTTFQRYLEKRGIEYSKGILSELTFECDNTSENYAENPFKIIRYLTGINSMSIVNQASKYKSEMIDIQTGEIKTVYKSRMITTPDGRRVKAYVAPQFFKRLIVQEIKEVEKIQ